MMFCEQCNSSAHFIQATLLHERVKPEQSVIYRTQSNCLIHPGQRIEFYCQTCEEVCCAVCCGAKSATQMQPPPYSSVTQSTQITPQQSVISSNSTLQFPLSAPHVGDGHLCISITDAYHQRHTQLSSVAATSLAGLRETLGETERRLEDKLIDIHSTKQKVDDETRAFFEGIRQRLKNATGTKQAVLQHSIRMARDDLAMIDNLMRVLSTQPSFSTLSQNSSAITAPQTSSVGSLSTVSGLSQSIAPPSLLTTSTSTKSFLSSISPYGSMIVPSPVIQAPTTNPVGAAIIDQIFFLRNYPSTKATVEHLLQRKAAIESGNAFAEADSIDGSDIPDEIRGIQDAMGATYSSRRESVLEEHIQRRRDERRRESEGRSSPSRASSAFPKYERSSPFSTPVPSSSQSVHSAMPLPTSSTSTKTIADLSQQITQWKEIADHQLLLLSQLRMRCAYCGITLSPSTVNEGCPGGVMWKPGHNSRGTDEGSESGTESQRSSYDGDSESASRSEWDSNTSRNSGSVDSASYTSTASEQVTPFHAHHSRQISRTPHSHHHHHRSYTHSSSRSSRSESSTPSSQRPHVLPPSSPMESPQRSPSASYHHSNSYSRSLSRPRSFSATIHHDSTRGENRSNRHSRSVSVSDVSPSRASTYSRHNSYQASADKTFRSSGDNPDEKGERIESGPRDHHFFVTYTMPEEAPYNSKPLTPEQLRRALGEY
ncbi:uncharacterized protein MONOS_2890 [Monocercomonoides exilis]|uniref:uncharacterized protein n=1 Tax=Monocercomonoides exilis TaxID=2049356 RepID=UPI00355A5D08|nr:hypothetical protein MONOS_2890 [Monocercomonoides exilis]|eukprot:MONOS_2890.1-p1 / transcript=MONOS_2890.1 / gene=MONOS_2890 / organism=Monocercomonoides_exilis_PA203 / gene_product=unspecified product / transcript_product=unspecified product / location=Mono_scaffold00063:9375-11845(-) / protein_length=713 / sequence_SO=supercontig / SO=protein_coding / is_pseudo=false